MLFLLKRTPWGGLLGLALLVPLGLFIRYDRDDVPPLGASWGALGLGVVVFGLVLASDAILNRLFATLFGETYLRRFRELAGLFREQSPLAMILGALLAGLGEELVFRGFTRRLDLLVVGALIFGLLHHVRGSLWLFTVWAAYQGLFFALALHLTGALFVTMVAHFLHDLGGFLLFRHRNRRARQLLPGGDESVRTSA